MRLCHDETPAAKRWRRTAADAHARRGDCLVSRRSATSHVPADRFRRCTDKARRRRDTPSGRRSARRRARRAHQVEDRHERGDRRRFHHDDQLVAERPQRHDRRLRHDDLPQDRAPAHAERARRLPLAAMHRLDRAAEDLRLIGGGVQREGEDRAVEGLAEEAPQADIGRGRAGTARRRNRRGRAGRAAACRGRT